MVGVAVYMHEEGIATRRWRIVGHDNTLLSRFPAEPEIYHEPQPSLPGVPPVGEFGSAETASGRMRDLTPPKRVPSISAEATDRSTPTTNSKESLPTSSLLPDVRRERDGDIVGERERELFLLTVSPRRS